MGVRAATTFRKPLKLAAVSHARTAYLVFPLPVRHHGSVNSGPLTRPQHRAQNEPHEGVVATALADAVSDPPAVYRRDSYDVAPRITTRMGDATTVTVSAHAAKRMDQFGIPNVAQFRRFIRDADGDYFDRKHRSKLVIVDDHRYAVAVADDAGIRTVITILPPPETSWSDRVSTHPNRYEALNAD